jgi:ATP-dependent DNA helicase RecG
LLIAESTDAVENERLQVMSQTNDGFVLAEHDLQQRGPGQFLGTRQSGYAELQLASLTDVRLIEKARRQAQLLSKSDPELSRPEHQALVASLERFWGGAQGDIS